MKLVIGSDHAGYPLKTKLVSWLKSQTGGHHHVRDIGTTSTDSTDYPDYAALVGKSVARGKAARGVLLCGTGIGMAMAANKVHGVRAAVCWNPVTAALAAEHNGANVICLPSRFLRTHQAHAILKAFFKTSFGGGRHARRVNKIRRLDRCG